MQLLYLASHRNDRWLLQALRQMGHAVEVADWNVETVRWAEEDGYDLILADMARPEPAEAQFLLAGAVPVVVVADRAEAAERTAILRAGAEACLGRPLHLIEVEARLGALARSSDRWRASPAARAGLRFDPSTRTIALGDRQVALSPAESRLVAYLLRREREVVDVGRLDRHLSGKAAEPRPERVQALVSRLRSKLGRVLGDPLIRGLPGHGYVLRLDQATGD